MGSLKLFIKAVRKAKTIAEERTVVRKQSAAIRTAFRDPNLDHTLRRINISKLLYLYILGEKTHFGQVECLKLLALPRFADKRLGYLAVMLLLDENQEVLTLLTNSLDNDMQHPNTFIVGLALLCLGNVALPELARDLYANVDRVLAGQSLAFLKKKACIVAAKLVEKDPDLAEVFVPHIDGLFAEKTPLLLLGACRLVELVHAQCPDHRQRLAKFLPHVIAHLRRIVTSGYLPDYDVGGVADPFLQVALLHTMRTLAVDCEGDVLNDVNDMLTQVALALDTGKNAAHAILYECTKAIFALRADQLLRVLGVNLLGKFLATKDNNTRYVALEMLLVVIEHEPLAVQRHQATIVACLGDGDVLIRRRALELAFAIVNELNVRVLMKEILHLLEHADDELKPYITAQVAVAAHRHAPSERWHFDTLVRMLKVAGSHVLLDSVLGILALVMRCESDARAHAVLLLVAAALELPNQHALALVACWCLGEYTDLVLNTTLATQPPTTLTEARATQLLADWTTTLFAEPEQTQLDMFVLTLALKLLTKLTQPEQVERVRLLLHARTHDNNLEIQTRAVEYTHILTEEPRLKQGLLAPMPAPPLKERQALSLQGAPKREPKEAPQHDLVALEEPASDLLLDIFLKPDTGLSAFANEHVNITFHPLFSSGQAVVEVAIAAASAAPVEHVQLLVAVPKSQKLTMTTSGSDSLVTSKQVKQTLRVTGAAGSRLKLRVKLKYTVSGKMTEDSFDFAGFQSTL